VEGRTGVHAHDEYTYLPSKVDSLLHAYYRHPKGMLSRTFGKLVIQVAGGVEGYKYHFRCRSFSKKTNLNGEAMTATNRSLTEKYFYPWDVLTLVSP